jgi:hypothetical protein
MGEYDPLHKCLLLNTWILLGMLGILALLFNPIAPYSTNKTAISNMTNRIIHNILPKMGVYVNANCNALACASIPQTAK